MFLEYQEMPGIGLVVLWKVWEVSPETLLETWQTWAEVRWTLSVTSSRKRFRRALLAFSDCWVMGE